MKKIILIFCMLFSILHVAQDSNFKNDYNSLLDFLKDENWRESEKLSETLLKSVESNNAMQTEAMVLRYIYLYSNAGLLNEKKITKDEALKNVLFLKGKEMILLSHPFRENCSLNCTSFASEHKDTFFTCVTNKKATQIFSFEYVNIPNGIKETEIQLTDKIIALKGVLSEISVEGNFLPRYKLKFINGEYKIDE